MIFLYDCYCPGCDSDTKQEVIYLPRWSSYRYRCTECDHVQEFGPPLNLWDHLTESTDAAQGDI